MVIGECNEPNKDMCFWLKNLDHSYLEESWRCTANIESDFICKTGPNLAVYSIVLFMYFLTCVHVSE